MKNFIPSFHFVPPSEKLTPAWCEQAVNYCYHNTNNINLLQGKDIDEIEGYATGEFDMTEFKNMYKSMRKALIKAEDPTNIFHKLKQNINTVGIGWYPLPLIPTKLNSAITTIEKIPVEVTATAQDPLAAKKKQDDLTFLKNKPALEADLQPIADQMQIGKVDLGTTKHSDIPFSSNPYGLDLSEPDEEKVFVDLLYNMTVETAFETVLQEFWDLKGGAQVKMLEIEDQFKFGVSCNRAFESDMTGLPDLEYVYPADMETPHSRLPDYSDNTHRFLRAAVTPLELFNYFGREIKDEAALNRMINGDGTGYCACNGKSPQMQHTWGSLKMELIYCEVKSIDYVSVAPINEKSNYNYIVPEDDTVTTSAPTTDKIWGQNTYGFWWLKNTKHFFGIHRLGFSHRTVGQESYQNFSTNIHKSQKKSAVQNSIGENKKAQIADIKLQHYIIMSKPAGTYFDLKYMRSALKGLTEENTKWTQADLINLIFEHNVMIGDTAEFDETKNGGQFMPTKDLPGGIKLSEIEGYVRTIADATLKISQFTGINEQLTGQAANPEGLIGLQKLLINSSINALHYANVAIEKQEQKVFNLWAVQVIAAVKRGGKAKQAIIDMIGSKKVSLIEALDDLPLHRMGIKVSINQREEEKQEFRDELARLKKLGIINTVDEYMLSSVVNPKDRMALLAVKVKQWEKKQDKIRAQQNEAAQAQIAATGKNMQDLQAAKTEGEIKKVYAQGDVNAKAMQYAAQLGMNSQQVDGVIKKTLQQDRGNSQLDKSIQTLKAKSDLDNQKPASA